MVIVLRFIIISLYHKFVLSPVELPVSSNELNVCLLSSLYEVFSPPKRFQSSHQDVCSYLGNSAATCQIQQY